MLTELEQSKTQERWPEAWRSFVSLVWYDGLIDFIFRFVAKTSEPLLAAGVIVSAADFLLQGRLMQGNLFLATSWAVTQAIAIESSGGVVLLYALQSFREKDAIKGWLYVALASLLAVVGGVMLFTQIISSTTGIDLIAKGPAAFVISMAVLRSIVSIAYIVMCRTKHIRFTNLIETSESNDSAMVPDPAIIKVQVDSSVQEALKDVLERIDATYQQRFDIALQEVKRTVTTVVQEEVTQSRLLAMPHQEKRNPLQVIDSKISENASVADSKSDRFAVVKAALIATPDITDKALAELANCSVNTVRKDRKKAVAELAKIVERH